MDTTGYNTEILIIGAGPAGLAAATCCITEGVSFMIIEQGKKADDRSYENFGEIVSGIGGSGLFCDGKLSYYPSASKLWNLPNENILKQSYTWLHNLISDFADNFPDFPDYRYSSHLFKFPMESKNNFKKKLYHSVVLNNFQRKELISRLTIPIKHKIKNGYCVEAIEKCDNGFTTLARSVLNNNSIIEISSKHIIFCGGRYGPLILREVAPYLAAFYRRHELGIRIEQNIDKFFLKDEDSIDTKLVFTDNEKLKEWRTFCCCRGGFVFQTKFANIIAYSGSTGGKIEKSNVGFNVRYLSSKLDSTTTSELNKIYGGELAPFKTDLKTFLSKKSEIFLGKNIDCDLREGLEKLCDNFSLNEAYIYGPCIEGVGYYPNITAQLQSFIRHFWIAGDSTGIFRGLLPALLSGFYVARIACKEQIEKVNDLMSNVAINKSPIDSMSLVFTAQSKKFFYSRDAICEFVLKKGAPQKNLCKS